MWQYRMKKREKRKKRRKKDESKSPEDEGFSGTRWRDDGDEDWWKSGANDPWFGTIYTSVRTILLWEWLGLLGWYLDDCAF